MSSLDKVKKVAFNKARKILQLKNNNILTDNQTKFEIKKNEIKEEMKLKKRKPIVATITRLIKMTIKNHVQIIKENLTDIYAFIC